MSATFENKEGRAFEGDAQAIFYMKRGRSFEYIR